MRKVLALICVAAITTGSAHAAAPPERVRGTVQSVTSASLTLKLVSGGTETIGLSSATSFAEVSKSSLDAIQPDSYIGTAAKGDGPNMVALEVVVFPPAMRGAGEGHYPWDPLPDVTKPGSTSTSSMTNGSVSSIAMRPKAASSMTNGSVQTVSTLPGAKQLSVVYKGGKQIILVLPTTPVVSVSKADLAVLQPGVHAFVVYSKGADGKPIALRVIAGADGITPPM